MHQNELIIITAILAAIIKSYELIMLHRSSLEEVKLIMIMTDNSKNNYNDLMADAVDSIYDLEDDKVENVN